MADDAAERRDGRPEATAYDEIEESRAVRPYTMTRGRTRPGHIDLPLEALVRAVSTDAVGSATSERRRILELSTATVQSVAELSAHLRLPLGVVRVLVGDLAEEGLVVVHTQKDQTPQSNLKVLESVLNGISSL
ncbi:MAG: hypothetical protein QOE01_587 [Actinomycetota bacterium]|jgi:hypothetical protein|nr:hypothetical protein [Actinomycetota bacterium]